MRSFDLAELLRDPSDISDFLAAAGQETPEDNRVARKQAVEIIRSIDSSRAIDCLLAFARHIARMANEVARFCKDHEVALNGQIQLPHDKLTLNLSGLETTWAFGGAVDLQTLELRAGALAAELDGLASQLNPTDLIRQFTEESITDLGRALKNSPNPVYSAMWRQIGGTTREIEHEICSQADIRALEFAVMAVEEAAATLSQGPVSAAAAAALEKVQERLPAVLASLQEKEIDPNGDPTPWVAGLTDEILLLATQLRNLSAEFVEGKRIQEGFHDFLRTEFWNARWRIYELWLLVRLLKTLHAVGRRVSLQGISNAVWTVQYGRARKPVAIVNFANGEIEVYYQYWHEDAERADMPDLVIKEHDGPFVIVLDPKHGKSYSRKKVQEVLARYAHNLRAGLTAVVNYFPMASYSFEFVRPFPPDSKPSLPSWILASDIAPGTNSFRRLEILVEDALRARGFHATLETKVIPPVPGRQRASTAIDLVFWSSKKREVDEPAGLWRSAYDGTTTRVEGFAASECHEQAKLEAAPSGKAMVVIRSPEILLLREKSSPRKISTCNSLVLMPSIGWSADSEYFIIPLSDGDRLFDGAGNDVGLLPGGAEAVGWDTKGHHLVCLLKKDGGHAIAFFDSSTRRFAWERMLPGKEGSFVWMHGREDCRVEPDPSGFLAASSLLG